MGGGGGGGDSATNEAAQRGNQPVQKPAFSGMAIVFLLKAWVNHNGNVPLKPRSQRKHCCSADTSLSC